MREKEIRSKDQSKWGNMIQKPVYKVYKDSILTEKINQPVKKNPKKTKKQNTVMLNGSKVE